MEFLSNIIFLFLKTKIYYFRITDLLEPLSLYCTLTHQLFSFLYYESPIKQLSYLLLPPKIYSHTHETILSSRFIIITSICVLTNNERKKV